MLRYEGTLYRPPSEADSLILQATIGCSWNRCTFCGMYRDKRFRVRPLAELAAEVEAVAAAGFEPRKVFLADGDALVARAAFLGELLDLLARTWPGLQRVSCYASPQALQVRTVAEMADLKARGLTLYYLGIESGHDEVLAALDKGVTAAEMAAAAAKAHEAGVKLSTMVLLGAGGEELSLDHARATADVVNRIQPRFLSTLVTTPVPGTPLWETAEQGAWTCPPPLALVRELRELLAHLDLRGTVFRSNHASNWLALAGRLPQDRDALLAFLDEVLAHPERAPLRPAALRGL